LSFFQIPLILASMTRPFGWWDWLVVPKAMLADEPSYFHRLVFRWIYLTNLFENPFTVRPTTAELYYFSYIAFHGEFWAWYVVKWTGFGIAVWWVNRLLVRFQIDLWTRVLIAVLLLFHPASFVLMLFSPDGWAALWIIGILLLMVRLAPAGRNPLDLTAYPLAGYIGFLLVVWLAAGIKEIVVVFLAVLAILAHVFSGFTRTGILRVLPIDLTAALYFWRMWQVSLATNRAGGNTVDNLYVHIKALAIPSPYWLMAILMTVATAYAVRMMFSSREDNRLRTTLLLALAASPAMLVFTSLVRHPAPRYVIPVVFLLSIPMAAAASRLSTAWDIPKIAAAILIPLLTASDHFSQTLAYQQLFEEKAGMINLIERRAADGYQIAIPCDPEDLPGEYQLTMKFFFNRFRQEFYGLPVLPPLVEIPKEEPRRRYAVIARSVADPARWTRPGFHFDTADRIDRGHYGVLEKLNQFFLRFDGAIGNTHKPRYDTGAPELSDMPVLQLAYYEQDRPEANPTAESDLRMESLNFSTGAEKLTKLDKNATFQSTFAGNERGIVRIPLHQVEGVWDIKLEGKVRVSRGIVSIGVGNDKGKDLWNTQIRQTESGIDLPQPPLLAFPPGAKYFVFFFVPGGADFEVAGFSLHKEPASRPSLFRMRRYGAFAY
jgi:hypothetical protein